MTDEQIVLKVLSGDDESYRDLVERYRSKLVAYVSYLIGNRTLAEDAVQDTLIKAYQNLRGFNPKLKFSSWIYRIAHNEAMNAIKKHKRELYLDDPAQWDDFTDSSPSVCEEIDDKIMQSEIKSCLSALDPKYRDPITLFYLQHKSYEEISDILRIPRSTVGVRIARGRSRLKTICKQRGISYEQR